MIGNAKVVVIAGAYRSGSTWMFNAVRLLLEEAGRPMEWGDWGTTFRHWEKLPSRGVLLVKEHRYFPELARIADLVLTSVRDWDDAGESWFRFQGERLTEAQVSARKSWLQNWQAHPFHGYCMPFERIRDQRKIHLDAIHNALGLDLDRRRVAQVLRRLDALRPPTGPVQDDTTLLFPNHITSGAVLV